MRLLVSVSTAAEARTARDAGADVIDAKAPEAGPLGAVSLDVLHDIRAAAGEHTVSAALGDAADERSVERLARAFAAARPAFMKVGFAGIDKVTHVEALLRGAIRGATGGHRATPGVVAVVYADAPLTLSVPPAAIVEAAARAGACGVLMDTADKEGPGLRGLIAPAELRAWVRRAHDAGLFVALAGRLTANDLAFVRDAGADIAGVRGAACDGGRTGRVVAEKVRRLRERCGPALERV